MLQAFASDFAHVAADEARHFGWVQQRLQQLGFEYGSLPAHNLLWENCQRTSGAELLLLGQSRQACCSARGSRQHFPSAAGQCLGEQGSIVHRFVQVT